MEEGECVLYWELLLYLDVCVYSFFNLICGIYEGMLEDVVVSDEVLGIDVVVEVFDVVLFVVELVLLYLEL